MSEFDILAPTPPVIDSKETFKGEYVSIGVRQNNNKWEVVVSTIENKKVIKEEVHTEDFMDLAMERFKILAGHNFMV